MDGIRNAWARLTNSPARLALTAAIALVAVAGGVAFAVAVFAGLMLAKAWLVAGGWTATDGPVVWQRSARDASLCAVVSSVTEAALTGGNDNVVVPVILWTCVKALGI